MFRDTSKLWLRFKTGFLSNVSREGPLIRALFEIRTTFKFRWVGGLEIRGSFKLENEKKAHTLKIILLVLKYSKTHLEIEKEFYMLFGGNIKLSMSFIILVHKYIF